MTEYAQLKRRVWRYKETDLVDGKIEQGPYEQFSDGERIVQVSPSPLVIEGKSALEYDINNKKNQIYNYWHATPLIGVFCLSSFGNSELFSEAFAADERAVELEWDNGDAKLTFGYGKPDWNMKFVLWLSRDHGWHPVRLQRFWDAQDTAFHDEWKVTRFVEDGKNWRIAEGTHLFHDRSRKNGVQDSKIEYWTDFKILKQKYGSDVDPRQFKCEIPAGAKVRGDQQADTEPPANTAPVTVNVVDAQGQPVSGAEVHLFQYAGGDQGRYVHSGPFTSDDQGRAVCAEAKFTNLTRGEPGNFDRFIYARVPGRLVGVGRSSKWTGREVLNPQGRVTLEPSRSAEGRVTVPAGFDPKQVTVRVRILQVYTGPNEFDCDSFPREDGFPGLDTALAGIFECHPDAQGHVRFDDVPVRGRLYLLAVGQGLGEAQWWNPSKTFDEPIRLTMEPESVVSGRVLAPDGAPAVGMRVTLRISDRTVSDEPRYGYLASFHAVTDGDGTFVLHGLPETTFVLSVEDPENRWTCRPLADVAAHPGRETTLTPQMEVGVLVSGRVLDPQGNPVPGAGFSAIADDHEGAGLADAHTDAGGRYQFRLPAGTAKLYFNSLPDGFNYPDPQIVKRLDLKPGQADIENLNFTLPRKLE